MTIVNPLVASSWKVWKLEKNLCHLSYVQAFSPTLHIAIFALHYVQK